MSKQKTDLLWMLLLIGLISAILLCLFVPAAWKFVNLHHSVVFICLMLIFTWSGIFSGLLTRKE
jgi:hypothetical protein